MQNTAWVEHKEYIAEYNIPVLALYNKRYNIIVFSYNYLNGDIKLNIINVELFWLSITIESFNERKSIFNVKNKYLQKFYIIFKHQLYFNWMI